MNFEKEIENFEIKYNNSNINNFSKEDRINENIELSKLNRNNFDKEKINSQRYDMLISLVMETAFVLSYGSDKKSVLPIGIFYPVDVDSNQNVIYERLPDGLSDDDNKERIYIPISHVLVYVRNSAFNLYDDEIYKLFSSFDEIDISSLRSSHESKKGSIYDLSEIGAKYYTGNKQRGENYSLMPFIIKKTMSKTRSFNYSDKDIKETIPMYEEYSSPYEEDSYGKENGPKISL